MRIRRYWFRKRLGLFWGACWVIERPKSVPDAIEIQAPARRRICHESRNSPELSYDYGRDDRWHRVPDALDLGQGRRQAEPRYRLQIAPGLDRRRPADPGSRRPRVAVPEEVLGLPQEGMRFRKPLIREKYRTPRLPGRFAASLRANGSRECAPDDGLSEVIHSAA